MLSSFESWATSSSWQVERLLCRWSCTGMRLPLPVLRTWCPPSTCFSCQRSGHPTSYLPRLSLAGSSGSLARATSALAGVLPMGFSLATALLQNWHRLAALGLLPASVASVAWQLVGLDPGQEIRQGRVARAKARLDNLLGRFPQRDDHLACCHSLLP